MEPVATTPVAEPKPQPVVEPRRVQPTSVATPAQPVVEKRVEPTPVVEKPVAEKSAEEKPVVEKPADNVEQPAKETPKNPFISSIQGKVQELRGGDAAEENTSNGGDSNEEQSSDVKTPWYAPLVRRLSKVRDAIFPETVEDDDISYR